MKVPALTTVAAIGLAVVATGCSAATSSTSPSPRASASATTQATTSPASSAKAAQAPAGYRRVGGAGQGISFAVPGSWVAVDLAKQTVNQAAAKIGLRGVSQSTLIQDMQSLQKLHALFIVDLKSTTASGAHFATNLNAYCVSSGLNDTGSAGVPILRQETITEFQQLHAEHIVQKDISVGGVPGVETSYNLSSSGAGTLAAAQLEVLPKPDRACFVTLTSARGQLPAGVLPTVAATAAFP